MINNYELRGICYIYYGFPLDKRAMFKSHLCSIGVSFRIILT